MRSSSLVSGRNRLLSFASEAFAANPDVVGVFLGGSLAAGTADAYSDIDLRVIVHAKRHSEFVARRCQIPSEWPGFLFNEWVPGAQHCVSHFRPFNKIDIFYLSADAVEPSPWLALPTTVLHDPSGVIATLQERSRNLSFAIDLGEVERSISKGIAAAHEVFRRTRRGELLYALTLLDELREHMMKADDWLHGRTPADALSSKFDDRGSAAVVKCLAASFCAYDKDALDLALTSLVSLYREQVMALHKTLSLDRPLSNDLEALAIIA